MRKARVIFRTLQTKTPGFHDLKAAAAASPESFEVLAATEAPEDKVYVTEGCVVVRENPPEGKPAGQPVLRIPLARVERIEYFETAE